MQIWAQNLYTMYDAESSQTEWSSEYFAKWLATPQTGALGHIPLIVLTRTEGGYSDGQDVTATQRESERTKGQAMLVQLSSNSKQVFVHSGHNMEVEAPEAVTAAIREMVEVIREHRSLGTSHP
jgi:hypothetical protein